MANINLLRQRLDSLTKNTKKSDFLWKPVATETTIRIVPNKYSPDTPFVELYFHYGINGKNYLSPVSFGQPDPIMEVANALKATGDKEDWKKGRKLEPKMRTYAPIIIRGKEHEGVKFWGFGKTVYSQLMQYMVDPDWGDISDPTHGNDIVVWAIQEEGKDFATPNFKIKPNKTMITTDKNVIDKIFENQPDIKEIYETPTYEELKNALQEHINKGKQSPSENNVENIATQYSANVPNVSDEDSDLDVESDLSEKELMAQFEKLYNKK